jgi:predicted dehydrogenase
MQRLRILLVSVGAFGGAYLRDLTSVPREADLAGIVEITPHPEERHPVIREKGIPVYPTLDAFYAVDHADLAIICSPIHLHTQMSLTCMKNGSHVLCEKPLCLTQEEVAQLDACSHETGRFLAVGYQLNYRRDVQAMKADILSGKFGTPKRLQVVHGYRRGSLYYARNNWAGHITVDGREVFDSPFNNACAHNFQMATFLLGKDMRSTCRVTGVDAELYRGNPNVENFDIAALRFTTDCGAPLYYYTAHPIPTEEFGPFGRFEFERAVITYDGAQRYVATMDDGRVIDYGLIPPTPYFQKIDDALACIREGTQPICGTGSEGAHIPAVRMVQQHPILDVDPSHVDIVQTQERGTCYYVHHLEETFLRSAREWALPREIGLTI